MSNEPQAKSNGGTTGSRKKSNANQTNQLPSSQMNKNINYSFHQNDILIVGEPTIMGGDFGEEDERLITRLENGQFDTIMIQQNQQFNAQINQRHNQQMMYQQQQQYQTSQQNVNNNYYMQQQTHQQYYHQQSSQTQQMYSQYNNQYNQNQQMMSFGFNDINNNTTNESNLVLPKISTIKHEISNYTPDEMVTPQSAPFDMINLDHPFIDEFKPKIDDDKKSDISDDLKQDTIKNDSTSTSGIGSDTHNDDDNDHLKDNNTNNINNDDFLRVKLSSIATTTPPSSSNSPRLKPNELISGES